MVHNADKQCIISMLSDDRFVAGEHPEAMQHGGNQRMGPSLGALAFISYVLLVYC